MAVEESHDKKGSRPTSSNEVDLESGKNKQNKDDENHDQAEVMVEKPKKKWFQKRKKEDEEVEKAVPYFQLFRYASLLDKILMVIGSLFGIANGAAMPLMMLLFGDMTDSFISFSQATIGPIGQNISMLGCVNTSLINFTAPRNFTPANTSIASEALENSVHRFMVYFIILACAVLVVSYLQISSWAVVSERQTYRIRVNFFKAIMRQDIGWFDTHKSGELITRLSDDINKIHDGIGDKAAIYCQWMAACVAGFTMGFVRGWKLTLVIIAVSPLLAIVAAFMSKLGSAFTNKELKAYSKAGGIAEEILSSIRTVVSFGGENKAYERYDNQLGHALYVGVKKGFVVGIGIGLTFLVMFGSYALAFWYGSTLISNGEMSGGKILTVFFSVMIGAMSLGHAAPCVENFANAKGAGAVVFEIIDTTPPIDSSSDEGEKPANVIGEIQLRNVNFTYPARTDVQVLNNFNLSIKHGQTLALVGSSGCGKSTIVQLIQRFYDPQDGSVEIDGRNIKTLNVSWLRQNIGIVSQEPCLFATTIRENIRNGYEQASDEDIVKAAQNANAHDFIKALPKGYDTMVGERGAQLSGGQKQRIAIARALVKNPKILLLDEATSALDNESESIVQAALDKAREGRTTVVIAHRLSTVRNANMLAALKDGAVAELGTHDELMDVKGIYYELVTNQTMGKLDDQEDEIPLVDEIEDFKNTSFREGSPSALDRSKRGRQSSVSKQLSRQLSSKSGNSDVEKVDEVEEEELPPVSFLKIMRLNRDEYGYIFIGTIGAIGQGAVMPVFAILFSEIIAVFAECDAAKRERDAVFWSLMFLALGAVSGLSVFFQTVMYAISGEYMTKRLRSLTFRAMLKQEIGWFDERSHTTGALCNRLATDASEVKGATGTRLGAVIQSVVAMVTALIIAFIYGWKLALVILACVPFIAVSGAIQMRVFIGGAKKNKDAADQAAEVSTEAMENIRTVESLNLEKKIIKLYIDNLKVMLKKSLLQAHVYGLAYGFSQAVIFFTYAAAFRFGAYLVARNEMNFADMFKVFSAIVFGALSLGQTSSFVPDYSKAKQSAARLFAILERESQINTDNDGGEKTNQNDTTIKFENVNFNYPSRPTIPVLDGISFTVKPGQTIALVGSSGCGKSTSVALLERFYDIAAGSITVGGKEVRNININWLRSLMGIVQQEPILFNTTIAENISYGDNTRTISRDEIITAAKAANIHDFIQGLPEGYNTAVGEKGTQMSGGQKQRIAIARALVRKPRILLLDEATSALDTESEKVVQAALDKAREGRTCIVIAHRLSTIRNADGIAVFHKGKITEFGTHDELMAKDGFYHKLHGSQV